ncbi:MAG TPA: lipoate--protein ligase family protein [Verrucomicrobiae bacterium]|nr:lipoate--protein ligase family protein [Verrucomicrobiae bacterium]
MKILDLTLPTPAENLACDEALLQSAEAGNSGEVLRFWESPTHFVVVGYANKVATEVNVAACDARNIPILRRCSGGGTVVQGPGCLNYALILKIADDKPTRNIHSANHFIMERNRAALAEIRNPKSEIRIEGHTDLAIDGVKFSGNSQRRQRKFLLFHGTFLFNFDLPLVSKLLHLPSLQPAYRQSRQHSDFVTNLNLEADVIKRALAEIWQAWQPVENVPLAAIKSLVQSKYDQRDWNFKF